MRTCAGCGTIFNNNVRRCQCGGAEFYTDQIFIQQPRMIIQPQMCVRCHRALARTSEGLCGPCHLINCI